MLLAPTRDASPPQVLAPMQLTISADAGRVAPTDELKIRGFAYALCKNHLNFVYALGSTHTKKLAQEPLHQLRNCIKRTYLNMTQSLIIVIVNIGKLSEIF